MFSVSAIALAAVASVIIVSEEADAYNSADYYFSRDIMESLSDSKGINEKDYSVQWKTEKNVAGPERANNGGDSTGTIGVGPIIAVSMLAVLLLGAIVFRNKD